jgi:hypothetical protein
MTFTPYAIWRCPRCHDCVGGYSSDAVDTCSNCYAPFPQMEKIEVVPMSLYQHMVEQWRAARR